MSTHSGGGSRSGSGFIRSQDVARWTAGGDPRVPPIGYHFSSEEHLASIRQNGVDVTRSTREQSDAYYGRGFYMYARNQEPFGDHPHSVAVAVRMTSPLVFHTDREAEAVMNGLVRHYLAAHPEQQRPHFMDGADHIYSALVTREVLARGHDGILALGAQFGTEIVAIAPGTVRVIRG